MRMLSIVYQEEQAKNSKSELELFRGNPQVSKYPDKKEPILLLKIIQKYSLRNLITKRVSSLKMYQNDP